MPRRTKLLDEKFLFEQWEVNPNSATRTCDSIRCHGLRAYCPKAAIKNQNSFFIWDISTELNFLTGMEHNEKSTFKLIYLKLATPNALLSSRRTSEF